MWRLKESKNAKDVGGKREKSERRSREKEIVSELMK
jgi:hypothetical protein